MRVDIEDSPPIQKPVATSGRHRPLPLLGNASGRGRAEIAMLARQIRHSPKARRHRRQIVRRVARRARDARDGSWARTVALVAIALTGIGLLKLIHNPRVSPEQVQADVHSGIDLAAPRDMLPPAHISQIDLKFIKRLEGFHATPYFDGTQRSWGYGTKAGRGSITRAQAEQEMKAYLKKHCLPILPKGLPAHKATALASFCYNLGPDQARQTDLWKAAHRDGRVNFLGYTRSARGVSLLSRRRKEQALWEAAIAD